MARTTIKIEASKEDRETLLKWRRSPTTPLKLVRRAGIILAAVKGLSNKSISRLFKNVVRGFSLVLHDPKGSHYKIWR